MLNFCAFTNGTSTTVLGQLTYTRIRDLSFKDYSRRKTFRTLFRLYHTKPYADQQLILTFNTTTVTTRTNGNGGFHVHDVQNLTSGILTKVVLANGYTVEVMDGMYDLKVQEINRKVIVVSDIDDTLLHSFIYRKLHKFKTLMFTTLENRKPVVSTQTLIQQIARSGAQPVYLSNSEQNLYPIIYRFLKHNNFPDGPIFLKQLRNLWDVLRNFKFPIRNIHKTGTLETLIRFFPEKKFVLIGDNTQHDLEIYLETAFKFPNQVKCILIRKVIDKPSDEKKIEAAKKELSKQVIQIIYSETFPEKIF